MTLASWMAREYCSTASRALGLVLPPGGNGSRPPTREKRVVVAELTSAGRGALGDGTRLTPGQRAALEGLQRDGQARVPELGRDMARRLEAPRARRAGRADRAPATRPSRHRCRERVAPAGAHGRAAAGAGPDPRRAARRRGSLSAARRHRLRQDRGLPAGGRRPRSRRGATAIVLVPEIALTPQALDRFEARFGDVVAVLHSGLGQGERYDEWLRLARGEARVCVGPRSAVFAPLVGHRADRRRRGARGLLQARGRPALRRAARGRAPRAPSTARCWSLGSATPRPESVAPAAAAAPPHPDRRAAAPAGRGARHARPASSAAPADAAALADAAPCRRQGDRAAQSPRLVELPLLPVLRPGVDVPQLRGRARAAPRRRSSSPATTAAIASGSRTLPRVRLGRGRAPRGGHRADRARAARGARRRAAFRCSASTPIQPASVAARGRSSASRRRRPGCLSAPRWWPRATTSRTWRSASCSTPIRRCGSRTSAPRSARSRSSRSSRDAPGRGAQRAPAACSSRRSRPRPASIVLAAHHDTDGFLAGELGAPQALGYPPFASLIRIVCSAERPGDAARRPARTRCTARIEPARRERARPRAAVRAARPRAQPARDQGDRPRGGDRRGRRTPSTQLARARPPRT